MTVFSNDFKKNPPVISGGKSVNQTPYARLMGTVMYSPRAQARGKSNKI